MKPTSLKQIATWVDGKLQTDCDITISSVGIDSRSLQAGQLFVAIIGENYDAHDFIDQGELEKADVQAAAVIVSRPVKTSLPVILVQDTRIALGLLAKNYRKTFQGKVIAVTGSNGKTSVKEMLASICGLDGLTIATKGNLNNDYGVPLSLLSINEEKYAVIEMGANHHGEIRYLSNLALPDVAIITNAGAAHLEGFGSIDGVATAKGEIYEGLSASGIAVINTDDSRHATWLELAKDKQIVTFGLNEKADYRAQLQRNAEMTSLVLHTPAGSAQVTLQLPGTHNVLNALAASAACASCGIALPVIVRGLEKMVSVSGRLQWRAGPNGMRILDDTYNANPTSLDAALNVLANLGGENWLILGDMGELGQDARELHEQAGRLARRAGIQRLFTYGKNAFYASDFFGEGGKHFANQADLINTVRRDWQGHGAVLVKGSRTMKMEEIVRALENNNLKQEDS